MSGVRVPPPLLQADNETSEKGRSIERPFFIAPSSTGAPEQDCTRVIQRFSPVQACATFAAVSCSGEVMSFGKVGWYAAAMMATVIIASHGYVSRDPGWIVAAILASLLVGATRLVISQSRSIRALRRKLEDPAEDESREEAAE